MVTAESTRLLLFSNALATVLALILRWPLETLLWPYWIQSVVIGWYSRRRMLALTEFSTDGLTMNDKPVPATPASLRSTANFFTLHYGFFHAGYLVFLASKTSGLSAWDWLAFAGMAVSFVVSHGASFRQNLDADARGRPNLGTLMFLPYARVVPMHLTIILGGTLANDSPMVVLLFSALKTGADVLMHRVHHGLLQRSIPVARNKESHDDRASER
jgi:hypothetical protein